MFDVQADDRRLSYIALGRRYIAKQTDAESGSYRSYRRGKFNPNKYTYSTNKPKKIQLECRERQLPYPKVNDLIFPVTDLTLAKLWTFSNGRLLTKLDQSPEVQINPQTRPIGGRISDYQGNWMPICSGRSCTAVRMARAGCLNFWLAGTRRRRGIVRSPLGETPGGEGHRRPAACWNKNSRE